MHPSSSSSSSSSSAEEHDDGGHLANFLNLRAGQAFLLYIPQKQMIVCAACDQRASMSHQVARQSFAICHDVLAILFEFRGGHLRRNDWTCSSEIPGLTFDDDKRNSPQIKSQNPACRNWKAKAPIVALCGPPCKAGKTALAMSPR